MSGFAPVAAILSSRRRERPREHKAGDGIDALEFLRLDVFERLDYYGVACHNGGFFESGPPVWKYVVSWARSFQTKNFAIASENR